MLFTCYLWRERVTTCALWFSVFVIHILRNTNPSTLIDAIHFNSNIIYLNYWTTIIKCCVFVSVAAEWRVRCECSVTRVTVTWRRDRVVGSESDVVRRNVTRRDANHGFVAGASQRGRDAAEERAPGGWLEGVQHQRGGAGEGERGVLGRHRLHLGRLCE